MQENQSDSFAKELEQSAGEVADYLSLHFDKEKGYPAREFYGSAFSIWLWSGWPEKYKKKIAECAEYIERSSKLDNKHGKYHWEFVRFALNSTFKETGRVDGFKNTAAILGRQRFAYTRVANWILLRSTVRCFSQSRIQRIIGSLERLTALLYFQKRNGFIEDEKHKPTIQYHAFSTSLVGLQILDFKKNDKFTGRRFKKAIDILDLLLFDSGQMNYLGRGQGQSFGYASGILAYVLAWRILRKEEYLIKANKIFYYLKSYQREDGSYPLVLRRDEVGYPGVIDTADINYLGWYSYNNYFDYLPFTAALLHKARTIIKEVSNTSPIKVNKNDRARDVDLLVDNFRIFENNLYKAIVVPPRKSLSSSQVMPYVEIKGRQPLPCYGGEEYDKHSVYTYEGLPLPLLLKDDGTKYYPFKGMIGRWEGKNTWTIMGDGIKLTRKFTFDPNKIETEDHIEIATKYKGWHIESPRILLYKDEYKYSDKEINIGCLRIVSSVPIRELEGEYYSTFGELLALGNSSLVKGSSSLVSKLQYIIYE